MNLFSTLPQYSILCVTCSTVTVVWDTSHVCLYTSVLVTTTEIESGILENPQASGTTYAIYRKLDGIEADIEVPTTSRWVESTSVVTLWLSEILQM